MTIAKNISLALALLLGAAVSTGCAADVSSDSDPDPDPDPNPDPDPLPDDVDASGKYQVKSTFDLATNAPGKAGDVARMFIDATNDADDPSSWLLDQLINSLSSGTFKNIIQGAKPFVAGYINDRLLEAAPDFVTTMITMGNDFGEVAKNFGLNETLDLTKSGTGYTGVHSVVGARFKINNVETDYAFADYSTEAITVPGVAVTLEPATGKLVLADHKVGLQYGKVLRIALDGAIIPSLDPSMSNLTQLLQSQVNCQVVGQAVNQAVVDTLGFGPGAGLFTTACNVGLQKAADLIYAKIAEIDGQALEFGLTGTAKIIDKNGDKTPDTIQTGTWAGTLSYAGTPAPLAGATFFGSRM